MGVITYYKPIECYPIINQLFPVFFVGLRKDSDDEGPCVPMARKCAPHSPRTTMKMGSLVGEGRCTDIIDVIDMCNIYI